MGKDDEHELIELLCRILKHYGWDDNDFKIKKSDSGAGVIVARMSTKKTKIYPNNDQSQIDFESDLLRGYFN